MKKTMITLAAMFAATVTMAAVTSQVVGYSSTGLGASKLYMLSTAGFEKVGGGNLTLGDIASALSFEDDDNIQFGLANEDGAVEFTDYFYISWQDPAGWYASDYSTLANDVEIPVGESVWINRASAADVTVSGAVNAAATTELSFLAGKLTLASSAYPVPFAPNSYVWTGLADDDNIQVGLANETGEVEFTDYFYISWQDPAGWYASDYSTLAGEICNVGQGFWIKTAGDATVAQPNPIQ